MTTATPAAPRLLDLLAPLFTARLRGLLDEQRLRPLLAAGPRPVAELAAERGLHARSLHRALRALACVGDVRETAPGVFEAATPDVPIFPGPPSALPPAPAAPAAPAAPVAPAAAAGPWQRLLADPDRAAGFARVFGPEGFAYSVRTGLPAFREVFGTGAFELFAADADASTGLHGTTASSTDAHAAAVVAGLRAERFAAVTDLGGGNAALAEELLRAHPDLRVTVLDQAPGARVAAARLSAHRDLDGRWSAVAGDFREAVPAGADAYVLKSVLHDWDDATCVTVLGRCRDALTPCGRVLVVERLLPPLARHRVADLDLVLSDLVCLLLSDGGRERGAAEYAGLFARAGLRPVGAPVACPPSPFHVLEAEPAAG